MCPHLVKTVTYQFSIKVSAQKHHHHHLICLNHFDRITLVNWLLFLCVCFFFGFCLRSLYMFACRPFILDSHMYFLFSGKPMCPFTKKSFSFFFISCCLYFWCVILFSMLFPDISIHSCFFSIFFVKLFMYVCIRYVFSSLFKIKPWIKEISILARCISLQSKLCKIQKTTKNC